MSKLHVKTGDTVVLLTGDYKDKYEDGGKRKTGKVLEVSPKEGKVIVEGINMITKHMKPTRMAESSRLNLLFMLQRFSLFALNAASLQELVTALKPRQTLLARKRKFL